ncbi:MAG: MauE/DoxX family redox-associated membrane protein [Pedobacter sp.]|uniref:MauE/DoxX family redox-associated membrane protein n=1 Tax=Pedobacter sp. TaxID=1411316 RepID=UPI00339AA079
MKAKHWITELIIFLLAALFIYTAVDKLLQYNRFVWQLDNQPFDKRLRPILAPALPAVELLLTILLLWRKTSLIGLYGAAILLSIFTIYIALVTFKFYERIPCSCATAFENLSWPVHLLINTVFLSIAVIGIRLAKQQSE